MRDVQPDVSVCPAGDQGFFIRFGNVISPEIHRRIAASVQALDRSRPPWLVDCIPTYCTILILYDSVKVESPQVRAWIEQTLSDAAGLSPERRLVEIPVWYDPSVGPDLEDLARAKGLSVDQVVAVHTAAEYLVYMLGFKPGFPFMGGLDERLWMQRLSTPRLAVAAGSVGIGGRQTGIYSVTSPGGWRILGRTPLRLFDLQRENCFLILPGDRVRFFPIDEVRYKELLPQSSGPQPTA